MEDIMRRQDAAADTPEDRRARGYAAKFVAETASYEPPTYKEPTDENLAKCFEHCARRPGIEEYGRIRRAVDAITTHRGDTMPNKFSLTIEFGNGTMQTADDVAEALLRVIARLQDGHTEGTVRDLNGNTVGHFELV